MPFFATFLAGAGIALVTGFIGRTFEGQLGRFGAVGAAVIAGGIAAVLFFSIFPLR